MPRTSRRRTDHEDVVGVARLASDGKHLDDVPELAMDVAAHGDRAGDRLDVCLFDEPAPDELAEVLDVGLGQVLALS